MSVETFIVDAQEAAVHRRENPEGITVAVLTDDEHIARALGVKVAEAVFPDRRFGEILSAELDEHGTSWEITVHDLGPVYRTTQGHKPPTSH